jgi:hypothetical protein
MFGEHPRRLVLVDGEQALVAGEQPFAEIGQQYLVPFRVANVQSANMLARLMATLGVPNCGELVMTTGLSTRAAERPQ